MFTPKRASMLSSPSSAKVTRSQSLKTKNELFNAAINGSGGASAGGAAGALNRISLTMSSIYNDTILESYKTPLPIRVNELIFQLKSQDGDQIKATLLTNGHVCLVNDRKAFIWKLKKSLKNVQCNELTLPFSRALIKQNCISIECHNNKDYVGICVTSEGSIRYWPSIFNEYLCVDAKIELQNNDESAHLLYIAENFYLVVTANGNLWSITIESEDGKITPICRQIDTSSGFMSSVGRRMTSLIFGSGSGSLIRNAQNFKSCVRYKTSNEMYILIDKNLQKWKINNDNTLMMTNQMNVEKLFYDEYLNQTQTTSRINISFQDCSLTKNSIYVLAIIDEDGSYKFAIGELDTYNRSNESTLKSFYILNYQINRMEANVQYKLHAMDNQHAFYVFNSNTIISFTGPTLELAGESKFNTLGDKIIASNFYDGDLIFFSLNHGILRTKDNSLRLSIDEENFNMSRGDVSQSHEGTFSMPHHHSMRANQTNPFVERGADLSNISIQSMDDVSFSVKAARQSFDFTMSNLGSADQMVLTRLKEAFQCYLRKDERESQMLLEEIFKMNQAEEKFDMICVELSEKLIDDLPAHDPRWAELNTTKSSKSMNTNLIISNQLKGKQRLHEYYITFLKKFSLWDRLSTVVYNGRNVKTIVALQEHGEKLQLALTIREQLYSKNPEFINSAIEYITKNRDEISSKVIYPHDLFYRRVSKIDDIFNALYSIENEVIKVNSNEQAINYIIDTIGFFNKLLKTSATYREEKARLYESQGSMDDYSSELIRWTFLPLNELINSTPSVMSICVKQHKLCSEYGLANCNTLENKSNILQSLFELDSLVFDEYETRLGSFNELPNENDHINLKLNYDSLKTKLIDVFIKHKQMENAMKLAEKYVDFSTLVTVCEIRSDADLLAAFLDKFNNPKFAEFVVRHFMEKKKLNFLLTNQFLTRMDISACLDKYKFLSWIKDFKNDNYFEASKTLETLASNEKESFMKQKSLLSLSKLSLLANDRTVPEQERKLNNLNRRMDYLRYIENMAAHISDYFALTLDQIPTYDAEKLIQIYINNEKATEIEFKKAFELIGYLKDDQQTYYTDVQTSQIKIEILVHSILADNWEKFYHLDYPETKLNETKFYKTLYLLQENGEDLEKLLELKDHILEHEMMSHLSKNKKFNYLFQACFELFI